MDCGPERRSPLLLQHAHREEHAAPARAASESGAHELDLPRAVWETATIAANGRCGHTVVWHCASSSAGAQAAVACPALAAARVHFLGRRRAGRVVRRALHRRGDPRGTLPFHRRAGRAVQGGGGAGHHVCRPESAVGGKQRGRVGEHCRSLRGRGRERRAGPFDISKPSHDVPKRVLSNVQVSPPRQRCGGCQMG